MQFFTSIYTDQMEKMSPRQRTEENWEPLKTGEGTERYTVEGVDVDLQWKEFSPGGEATTEDAVVFLPGWAAGNAKTLEDLTGRLAKEAGSRSFQFQTRSDAVQSDLTRDARAIRDSIVKRGLTNITLAAHSEGGVKAVDLIDLMQRENPDIQIRGLILLSPVGLYEQTSSELAGKFAKDSLVQTPRSVVKNIFKNPALIVQAARASTDIVLNIGREVWQNGTSYPEKLRSEIAEMAARNEHYKDVRCPVVLIQGADDPVSSAAEVMPPDEDPKTLTARSEILRKTFFPNAPRVDMLIPKKLGHHGLPHFRSEKLSKAAFYLLRRYEREKTP